MLDNQEEEFLDKDKLAEQEQSEEEVQEEPKEEEIVPHYDPTSQAYKCCHEALKRETSLVFFWVIFLFLFLGGIIALFATQVLDFESKKKEAITLIPYASVAAMGIIAKIVALMKNQAYFKSEKDNYLSALPEEPNRLIQDFYLLQQCRKCSQYWITLIMVFISVFTAVYCVIVSVILKWAGQSEISSVFQMDSKLGFGKDTVCGVLTIALMTIPVWFLCYQFASGRTNEVIKGLEATYPKEKIIDCSLCRHKLEVSNKKKKLIAFGVVVTLGFFIYFFFKRFTCTLFEKSFEF